MWHHMVRPFVYMSLFSYLSPPFRNVSAPDASRFLGGRSRSWSPPEVVGHIDLVDVHGGHSSCGSVTGASRFLIGLVTDMCAPRASASTSSGCAYSRSIRSRTRRSRARTD